MSYLNGSIEGTEFLVRVGDSATDIAVFEGVVVAANDQGPAVLHPGVAARAAAGQSPPRRTLVRPRDQVQWALYYPPIINLSAVKSESSATRRAANYVVNGNFGCAFTALDQVPAERRDPTFYLLRASVLLSVGRVDEARADIDTLRSLNSKAGGDYALRAVIAVTLNDRRVALADARRDVELSPISAVP